MYSWDSTVADICAYRPLTLSHHTVMYTPAGTQRCPEGTPSSITSDIGPSPSESTTHATFHPKYSQSSYGSSSDANTNRSSSRMSHPIEHLPSFDPFYRQYQGLGTSSGTHLHHDPSQLGYWSLYSPPTRPGRRGLGLHLGISKESGKVGGEEFREGHGGHAP